MNEDQFSLSVSLPLDRDGFLRRQCPNCGREFKWLPQDDGEPVPDDGYACPYCTKRSTDDWLTRGQERVVRAAVEKEVIEPQVKELEDAVADLNRAGGGLFSASLEREASLEPTRLTERDDMRRVDFNCHPNEPVKVLDDWTDSVHCLICGQPWRA
jgi:hypothetical protein